MDANEKRIERALAKSLPAIADLFGANEIARLAKAWEAGVSRAFFHPFIEALLGDHHRPRLPTLNAGLDAMRAYGNDLSGHVRRMTLKATNTAAFSQALGAMNELWAASSCAAAGATVSFHPTGPKKTPDISARIYGEEFTLEVTTLGLPDAQVRTGNQLNHDFRHWKRGRPVPKSLQGFARDHGHVRMLSMPRGILGHGNTDEKVQTLVGKKTSAQLKGHPNPVLVISGRHQWGMSAKDCLPRNCFNRGFYTGVCHAAVYGRAGDYLFQGEEFDSRGRERHRPVAERYPSSKQLNCGSALPVPRSQGCAFRESRTRRRVLETQPGEFRVASVRRGPSCVDHQASIG